MTTSELLEQTQRKLNISLSEHLEKGINSLLSIIDNDSNLASDVYQMRGKFYEVEQDSIKGIIKYEDKMFYSNQVRVGILEIIDNLTINDFTKDSEFWSEDEKTLLKSAVKPTPVISEEPIPEQVTKNPVSAQLPDEQPTATLTNQKVYTVEDLELIKAQHTKLLSYFSVTYREISALVYRGSNDDQISIIVNSFNSNIDQLKQFKELLTDLKANEHQLKGLEKEEYYLILIRRMVDFKSTLKSDSIPEIQTKLLELKELHQEIKNANA